LGTQFILAADIPGPCLRKDSEQVSAAFADR
jgi:hypothetical protein